MNKNLSGYKHYFQYINENVKPDKMTREELKQAGYAWVKDSGDYFGSVIQSVARGVDSLTDEEFEQVRIMYKKYKRPKFLGFLKDKMIIFKG